jgi:hypothetical protein
LCDALDAARQALRAAGSGFNRARALSPLEAVAQAAARWSLVHGFAMLLLDGRLGEMIASLPEGTDADMLLNAILATTRVSD